MVAHEEGVVSRATDGPRTLSIDVGGTGLKAAVLGPAGTMLSERVRIDTPRPCPPEVMVRALRELVSPPALTSDFDRISVGFPGVVRDGRVVTAPHFGNDIWHGFELGAALEKELARPVRLLNDADMQGFGAIRGHGLEFVMTLGTGFGTALFRSGELMPHLEIAHHPLRKGMTYNEYLGDAALQAIGKKKWNRRVRWAVDVLRTLINYDHAFIGGGNARKLAFELDPDMTVVDNRAGILGGIALWESPVAR